MKERRHSVRYNFIMNFILTASQFLFPLITFPYVSRVLLAEGNGKISFAASVANYFLMTASLGIPTYGIRACAQVRDDRQKLSKTVQEIWLINLVTTVLVMVTYLACIFCIPRFRADKVLFLINGANIVLNLFGMNWLFQALEQYDYITFRSLIFKAISVVLMFGLVHDADDYVVYGAISVFAAVGSNIMNFIRMHRYVDFHWTENYRIRRHLKPIFVLFAQSLAVSVYTNLDTVMLGFIKTDKDVGYYNAAVKIKTILLSLVTSLGNVLLPRMSYYAKQRETKAFQETMEKALNFTMLLAGPLVVYFVAFAGESIRFLAGTGYEGAVLAMQIITVAIIPNGLTGVLGVQVLTALEKEQYVLYSVIVGACTDFLLNLTFIPAYGAAGAALATVIAEFMVLFVQMYYTRSLLSRIKHNLRGAVYILLSLLCGGIVYWIPIKKLESDFWKLFCSAAVFFSVYGIGLLVAHEEMVWEILNGCLRKLGWKGRENG